MILQKSSIIIYELLPLWLRHKVQAPERGLCFLWLWKMRTTVYIDGFNLYYGSLKQSKAKWLDLFIYFSKMLPSDCKLEKVKYFTARVRPLPNDRDAPNRQDVYFRALKAMYGEKIEIIEGRFSIKTKKTPLEENPKKIVRVIQAEEKGSDVNLAVEMVHDGWSDKFDCAVVVTNDSDIERALSILKKHLKKKVFLFTPGAPQRTPLAVMNRWSHKQFDMLIEDLLNNQLPNPIPNTEIYKPENW